MYINLATGVGMEEKSDVVFAHKKVLQGSFVNFLLDADGKKCLMDAQDTILRVCKTE